MTSSIVRRKLIKTRLSAEEGFIVILYKSRIQLGGLWNFSNQPETADGRSASAVYGELDTNFPRQLMELQDYPYEKQPLFMPHDRILKYLKDYSKTISGDDLRLRSDREVIDLYYEKSDSKDPGVWHLTSRDVSTGLKLERDFEGVVIAVGMYDKPYMRDYDCLKKWKDRWPETLSHAKAYRAPKTFKDKVSRSHSFLVYAVPKEAAED